MLRVSLFFACALSLGGCATSPFAPVGASDEREIRLAAYASFAKGDTDGFLIGEREEFVRELTARLGVSSLFPSHGESLAQKPMRELRIDRVVVDGNAASVEISLRNSSSSPEVVVISLAKNAGQWIAHAWKTKPNKALEPTRSSVLNFRKSCPTSPPVLRVAHL